MCPDPRFDCTYTQFVRHVIVSCVMAVSWKPTMNIEESLAWRSAEKPRHGDFGPSGKKSLFLPWRFVGSLVFSPPFVVWS